MDLQQVVMTTFVLLQATWPVEQSAHLVEQLQPSHVIVHHRDQHDAYYLFPAQEALALLTHASNVPSLQEALHVQERMATPAFESAMDAEDVPDQCVVLEGGHLVGFFDASVPPQYMPLRRGGDTALGSTNPEVEPRSLVAELPETVHLHESFSLLVFLSASPMSETGRGLPFVLPLGTSVDILVQPRRGLVLEGSGEGQLVVSSEEETLPLQFKLRGVGLGPGHLRVLAFHQGQPLGALTLTVAVLDHSMKTEIQHQSREQSLALLRVRQPDLSLLILEHTEAGMPAFTFRLTAQDPAFELNLKLFGPIRLKVDALHYFQEFFTGIETLPLNTRSEKAIAEHRLAAKGAHLFTSLFPADLQRLLWSLRNRIHSVQVQSEEPWIPWELCKLCGQDNGRVVEGPFLCEAFALTRWLPGIALKPSLKLTQMAVVVPADSGLTFAPREREYLLSLAAGSRQVKRVPPTFVELRAALASGEYDGWHFSGHGGFRGTDPNTAAMYLENQDPPLTPEDLSGEVSNLGKAKPLVFLNACQIGRSALSLTGIGGWAKQFLAAGAGAFIGAYWSIYDKPALDFAQAFYSRLLSGMPIGKAAQEARLTIKPAGDPTWLAYTVFADPLATVREEPTPSHR